LLDEPFSSLDVGHQQALIKHFRRLSERGLAIILILHDINALAQAADRLLILDKGSCLGIGTPNEIITPVLLKNTFKVDAQITSNPITGAPWMNLL
jgi:iron complex transport system ATP-binding protein